MEQKWQVAREKRGLQTIGGLGESRFTSGYASLDNAMPLLDAIVSWQVVIGWGLVTSIFFGNSTTPILHPSQNVAALISRISVIPQGGTGSKGNTPSLLDQ